ncbi:phosphotransferase [Nocardia brevicatena]|uniref:phosphotransferase n=1 Tax=Nocardia brevicatena TaxID=37327 RepID=UPI0034D749FE
MPTERWTGIAHGDFRPGNLLIGPDGTVRAVPDWELWTICDVMADVGRLAAWSSADPFGWAPIPPTAASMSTRCCPATQPPRAGHSTICPTTRPSPCGAWRPSPRESRPASAPG